MPRPTAKAGTRKKMQTANRQKPDDANAKAPSSRTTAALLPKSHDAEMARGAVTANSANVSSNVARTPNTPVPNKAGYQETAPTTDAMKGDREARSNETLTHRARTSDESKLGTGPAFLEPRKTGKR
ncbi:MAG: hypothetical protein WKH97_05345 [Casimicrobiaceae bacterium]